MGRHRHDVSAAAQARRPFDVGRRVRVGHRQVVCLVLRERD